MIIDNSQNCFLKRINLLRVVSKIRSLSALGIYVNISMGSV